MLTLKKLQKKLVNNISNKDPTTIIGGTLLTIIAGFGFRKIIDKIYRKINNYPPGPIGIPLFGCLFKEIFDNKFFKYLSNYYGSVVMVQIGFRYVTYINDVNIVKKVFKTAEFSYREPNSTTVKSISSLNGKKFLERRQLFLRSFISIINSSYLNTVGGKDLEKNWLKEFDNFADKKQPFCPEPYLQYGVFVMLFRALFGDYLKTPKMNDKGYNDHVDFWDDIALNALLNRIWDFGLKPFYHSKLDNNAIKAFHDITNWVIKFEEEYSKKQNNKNDEVEPLVATLINKNLKKYDLYLDVGTVLIAGITTTKSFLTRILVLLCVLPDIQNKIYNELKGYENKYGEFKLKNIHELHYLRATCHEAFRCMSNSSGLDRYILNNNIKVNGYNIPKGSLVYGSYSLMMHDNNNWVDSGINFNINNFLDNNNKFKQNDAFVMFGTGKRSCPGESLAKRELYYVFGKLVLRYKFSANPDIINKVKTFGDTRLTTEDPWKFVPIIFKKRE